MPKRGRGKRMEVKMVMVRERGARVGFLTGEQIIYVKWGRG